MNAILKSLRAHTFASHTIAFLSMMVPPILMFFAAKKDSPGWILGLLSLVILGNLIELVLK